MAKKKATMTLKDFHGGSIPSDLPLPSAPGVVVRPSDRVGFDRQSVWGNPVGRSDHRLRPGSAGGIRRYDDKTPFLNNVALIGRNFDEDERTPLDGVSGPRRTVSDESICVPVVGSKAGPDRIVLNDIPVSNPASYDARFSERVNTQGRMGYQNVGGGSGGQSVGQVFPNAWAMRKDLVVQDQVTASWSAPDAVTKLAHASALDKVSSGRWHSKQSSNSQVDIEVITHPEPQGEAYLQGYGNLDRHIHGKVDVEDRIEYQEDNLVRQMDKSLIVKDGICAGGKALSVQERAMPRSYSVQERRYDDVHPPSVSVGKFVGSELHGMLPPESSERPKLNLLQKSTVEPPLADYKQSYHNPKDPIHQSHTGEAYERSNTFMSDPESGSRVHDRPKLNLKPRLQPLAQSEGNIETKRNTLFGGARPRELVLKERGVDDIAVNNHDQVHLSNRLKQDAPKVEKPPVRYNGKAENTPLDHWIGNNIDRRDHRGNAQKSDMQRRNWRSENRRSSKELEKRQPPMERPQSPETWRKPVEQPLSPTGLRYGKAASAVELAHAFSKSVSKPKSTDWLSGQRSVPGRVQIPFSRLTSPQTRSHVDGY